MRDKTPNGGNSLASRRPARIPKWALVVGMLLLTSSFISGAFIWWGQTVNARYDGVDNVRYFELKIWLRFHSALNPFLCGLLGYLTHQHMRVGFHIKANRFSGAVMFIVMAGLAVTGTALYYSGGETLRPILVWTHRSLGLALPIVLASHWIAALRWVKKL